MPILCPPGGVEGESQDWVDCVLSEGWRGGERGGGRRREGERSEAGSGEGGLSPQQGEDTPGGRKVHKRVLFAVSAFVAHVHS